MLIQVMGPIGLVIAMVAQAIFAPIPSELMLAAAGAAFVKQYGIVVGIAIVVMFGSIGSCLGATAAFYIARKGGREVALKFVSIEEIAFVDDLVERHGVMVILMGRLLPFIPFDAISYGAGLTKIEYRKFIVPTIIGVIPRAFFYGSVGILFQDQLERNFNMALLLLVIAITVAYVMYIQYKKHLKQRFQNSSDEDAASSAVPSAEDDRTTDETVKPETPLISGQ